MKPNNRRKMQKLKARRQMTRFHRWMVRWQVRHDMLCDPKMCQD